MTYRDCAHGNQISWKHCKQAAHLVRIHLIPSQHLALIAGIREEEHVSLVRVGRGLLTKVQMAVLHALAAVIIPYVDWAR